MSRTGILLSALGAVLLVVAWWFLFYTPGQEDLQRVEDETTAAQSQTVQLEGVITRLETVRMTAPEVEADIARLRGIVPADAAQPATLRQLQSAADDAGVTLEAITIARPGDPAEGQLASTQGFTMNGSGSYFQIVDLVRRVQDPRIVSRGIDLGAVTVTPAEYPSLAFTVAGEMFAVLPDPPSAEPPPPAEEPTDADGDADGAEEGGE